MSDTPENGFGQGAVNNSTGWGKGVANSSLGWGTIHPLTFGHPNTNLTGEGGTVPFPTDLLDWSQIFNNAYEVNSGSGLDFVEGNGDYVELSSPFNPSGDWAFSFIRCNTPTGTGRVLGVSGSTTRFIQSNATTITVRFGNSATLRSLSAPNTMGDKLMVTYTISTNEFNAYVNDVLTDTQLANTTNTPNYNLNVLSRSGNNYYTQQLCQVILVDGTTTHTFNLNESNGSTIYSTTSSLTGTINGSSWLTGRSKGEQLYEWGWNRYTTAGVLDNTSGTVYITGETKDATTDINGNAIARPAIANFYNAPAYANHYAQIEELAGGEIDTSSAITTAFWINPQEGGTIYDNGKIKATYNGTNLTFTRDGVTTISYAVALTELTYFAITSDASGVTNIYQANQSTSPSIVVTNQAGGTPTAASVPMYANNTNALNGRYGGYNQLTGFWSKVLTTEEIEAAWSA